MEFRADSYERYHDQVLRHTALHLADELWSGYPQRAILDWVSAQLELPSEAKIAELGCGVGRLIGSLAQEFPETTCWGIDYSYQMLRQAYDYWIAGETIELDWSAKGFAPCQLQGQTLANLQLGLAKAEDLPFESESLDVVLNSFLLDRVVEPEKVLAEIHRVLRPHGRLLLLSPLNFQQAAQWQAYFPIPKLVKAIEHQGLKVISPPTEFVVKEPLDAGGNEIHWRAWGIIAEKGTKKE